MYLWDTPLTLLEDKEISPESSYRPKPQAGGGKNLGRY